MNVSKNMPNNTDNTNNPSNPTDTTSGTVNNSKSSPAITTEYFDVPPFPQVKQDGNQTNNQSPNTTSTPPPTPLVSKPEENDSKPPVETPPMATTQVMGSTVDNLGSKNKTEIPSSTPKNVEIFKPKKGGRGKRIVVPTILGLLLLAGGLATGVVLIKQNQDVRERAQTTTCTGCLDASGNCIEVNSTTNSQCGISGQTCVSCTASQTCESGVCAIQQTTTQTPAVQCLNVEAYSVDEEIGIDNPSAWTKLTQNDLSKLTAGEYVYFTITGKDTSGDTTKFTKARFKVNAEPFAQVDAATNTKPAATSDPADEIKLYYKYKIPTSTKQFEVKAAIYHSDRDWIDAIEE